MEIIYDQNCYVVCTNSEKVTHINIPFDPNLAPIARRVAEARAGDYADYWRVTTFVVHCTEASAIIVDEIEPRGFE